MQYHFIINPISGSRRNKKRIIQRIQNAFPARTKSTVKFTITEKPGQATIKAKEAADAGCEVVVAVGGDGTVNEVAIGLIHKQTRLGIIPIGSGNGFARSMGIPKNINGAFEILRRHNEKKIDVGRINEFYFFGVSGVGFDARLSARYQNFGIRGPLPYFYLGLREIIKYNSTLYTLKLPDQTVQVRPLLITVANTKQYGNGAVIAPNADASDSQLNVCIIEDLSFVQAAFNVPYLFNGKILQSKVYQQYVADEMAIVRDEPGWLHTDGEPKWSGSELKVRVMPKALHVCVPA